MCSPKVSRVVRQRIAREGLPKVSRRGFLKAGGILAAAMAAGNAPRMAKAAPRAQDMGGDVVDLSHMLSPDFPVFPGFDRATTSPLVTVEENGFYSQEWTFGEHTSTHMDAPAHFIGDGALVTDLDPSALVGPAVVINIADRAAENPDTMLEVADIEAWEEANGAMPEGAFVCMYSGWAEKYLEQGADAFMGTDDEGVLHFPGFSNAAAEFLVNERDIKGIGVDTASQDHGPSATFDVHYTILGAGLIGVENLNNLASIQDTIATVVFGIPKYENGSGGPLRALAFT